MKYAVYLLLTICFVSTIQIEEEKPPETRITGGVPTTTVSPKVDSIETIINKFGLKLLKTMMKQNVNKNVVISPVGIAGLLAMTLLGSTGVTYDELSQVLGFSQDILNNRDHHENFGKSLHALNGNGTNTLYANAVFVDSHTKLRQAYRSYLERVYDGEAIYANFGSEQVKDIINEWVKTHTKSKIENFLQQPLPASTKAVLLSALYFSGQWTEPFIPEYTRYFPFHSPAGKIEIEAMVNLAQFNYIFSEDDGLQMIQLPYNDSITNMYVIKPRLHRRLNLTDLMDGLDYDKIDNLINQLSKKKCIVRFPKMQLSSKSDLKSALKALGAQSMFTPGVANFAIMLDNTNNTSDSGENLINRINGEDKSLYLKEIVNKLPNPGVHVDSVLHEVKMNIDEYGTEAVAATSGVMARTAETFYADSPFFMFIRNDKTKLITFSAVLYDPTE